MITTMTNNNKRMEYDIVCPVDHFPYRRDANTYRHGGLFAYI